MKAAYKGHEIDVKRERAMGGWQSIYYSIFRQSDRYECMSGFSAEDRTPIAQFMRLMKERVDAELAERNPWMEFEECPQCDGLIGSEWNRCACLDDDEVEFDLCEVSE
jgi:hypothetical protein